MNSPGSFHPTSDVMSDLSKLCFRFVTYWTDLVKYSCWKRCFIVRVIHFMIYFYSKLVYKHVMFLFDIWLRRFTFTTCWYLLYCNWNLFFREKNVLEEVFHRKVLSNRVKIWVFLIFWAKYMELSVWRLNVSLLKILEVYHSI